MLSYASMAANSIFNELRSSDALLLAEGVNVFTVIVPPSLEDLTIAKSGVRSETGCTVIALEIDGRRNVNPPPETILEGKATMVLVGNLDAEEKFMNEFVRTSH